MGNRNSRSPSPAPPRSIYNPDTMYPVTRSLGTALSTVGHVSCIAILFFSNMFVGAVEYCARSLVWVISGLSGAAIEQDSRAVHTERVTTFQNFSNGKGPLVYKPGTGAQNGKGPDQVLDEKATMKKTVEYITREQNGADFGDLLGNTEKLTELAHKMIMNEFGGADPSLLSEDFQFLFPVVGPLTKEQFVEAFTKFEVREAFPTSRANFYNFNVDALEPNRIWMMSRGIYEHLGTLKFGPQEFKATGKKACLPPQMFSMSFDPAGKCYKLTGGYNVDRSAGDTKGLGGMFGIIVALGLTKLPFPEGRPWQRSLMWEAFALRVPQITMDWKKLCKSDDSKKLL